MVLVSNRAGVSEFRERIRGMAGLAVFGLLILLGRMMQLQIFDGAKYRREAQENILRVIYVPSTRGIIRDTHGRVIAANRPTYNVYVVPRWISRRMDEVYPKLAEYLGLTRDERDRLEARIRSVDGRRRDQYILVRPDIDRETLAILDTHRDELHGVSVIAVPLRTYPFGTLAAHALGYINEVSAEDLESHPGEDYRAGDRMGRMGVERAWESILRGRRGWVRVDRDHRGVILSTRDEIAQFGPDRRQDPVPGRDLVLSLDMELMRSTERAFAQRGHPSGAVAVVNVRTGGVLALYSRPSLDPNEMTMGVSLPRLRELSDPRGLRPLVDRSIYEMYPPGSTFKPFTAVAALNAGLLDPSETMRCDGFIVRGRRRFRCAHGHIHGRVDLLSALIQSCNVYFFQVGETAQMNRIARAAFDFGLGRRTGIGINSEASGFIPTREWYARAYPGQWRLGFTLNTAIGQQSTRTTVLQLALSYAALANGGTLYVPQLIQRVTAPDGHVLQEFPPTVRRRVDVNEAQLQLIDRALRGVVGDPRGTAHSVDMPEVALAGKTGTAQVSRSTREGDDPRRSQDHAWFAGFAPAENPEIAIVVLVEHGGSGGAEAAPVAAQIVRDYFTRVRTGAPIESVARANARASRERQRVGRVAPHRGRH
ncbi:MAG: penicillin-binding protein 2 [Deltaproteobacteria bacterium]|nr:penicillin-binding protein 2 [Deltaproteobacteria bacterium]